MGRSPQIVCPFKALCVCSSLKIMRPFSGSSYIIGEQNDARVYSLRAYQWMTQIYDYLLTVDNEAQFIWRSRWGFIKWWYIMIRFCPILDIGFSLYCASQFSWYIQFQSHRDRWNADNLAPNIPISTCRWTFSLISCKPAMYLAHTPNVLTHFSRRVDHYRHSCF